MENLWDLQAKFSIQTDCHCQLLLLPHQPALFANLEVVMKNVLQLVRFRDCSRCLAAGVLLLIYKQLSNDNQMDSGTTELDDRGWVTGDVLRSVIGMSQGLVRKGMIV